MSNHALLIFSRLYYIYIYDRVLAPCEVKEIDINDQFFATLNWDDVWEDGKMAEVIAYLRSNKHITLPDNVDFGKVPLMT